MFTRKEIFNLIDLYFDEKCTNLRLSESKKWQIWNEYETGVDYIDSCNSVFDVLKVKTNYPIYWLGKGASVSEAWRLSTEPKLWSVCRYCSTIFSKSTGYKTCCCEDHYKKRRLDGNIKLSNSRKKYNPRNSEHYANRHNVSIEDAVSIVGKLNNSATRRRVEFWLKRGFSEEEAREKVSEIQRKVSPRSASYWIDKGYSNEESAILVSEYQQKNGKRNKEKHGCVRKFSPRCIEYWLDKGLTDVDGYVMISKIQSEKSKKYLTEVPREIRKESIWTCKEYYQKRFPDTWQVEYSNAMSSKKSDNYRSKVADTFFDKLNEKFISLNSKRYFKEKEFAVYDSISSRVVKFDYVDTTLKIVVEFNGDYWHANPNLYSATDVISYPGGRKMLAEDVWNSDAAKLKLMTDRGYRIFVVWEKDVNSDVDQVLDDLYKEIMNEN